ncbi:hypothetical protein FOA52_004648 [Chlamydomonas sp. UWO 241]|nr:hypothetical protein FOA52_004648 [Chlamydomonas sp. UWO 241]
MPPDSDSLKIRIGVCAMDKKARSKPMKEVVTRITSFNEFEVVFFGDECILGEAVENWPQVDCLLSWHSDGFPLDKAMTYVQLRRPFCVNDITQLEMLLDRRKVYRTLIDNSIPVPSHIIVSRDDLEEGQTDPPGFIEEPDYVELNGTRICKPFVEKPASGEDHNVHIYYPHSMGGGVKRLFRKVDNKSSQYDELHPGCVRRDGSYIYEEFLTTGGTDVKVYTVGPRYAHAEARKSPVVDGKVQRSADGKELRFPVLLSPQEKEIARMVTLAFGQKVCGFDLLRSERGKAYVCDVNGWSFVKNSKKYYDDAAGILRSIILTALAPHWLNSMPFLMPANPATVPEAPGGDEDSGMGPRDESFMGLMDPDDMEDDNPEEELRCVLAVIRHGDRTPKQKMKMKVSQPTYLALFDRYKDSKGIQAKLKTPQQLQELLDSTRALQQQLSAEGGGDGAGGGNGDDAEVAADDLRELKERLQIVRTVLEAGGQFKGVNRKVQLKRIMPASVAAAKEAAPSAAPVEPSEPIPEGMVAPPAASFTSMGQALLPADDGPVELLLVLKWGGVLTHAGRAHAEALGTHFRAVMYPRYGPAGGGLLRLHSTYRHDLKIYSSDEGRVQTSAAAFTKGLLDLEGDSLTPILVSLVNKDASMLEAFGKGASDDMRRAKEVLYSHLTWDGHKSQLHVLVEELRLRAMSEATADKARKDAEKSALQTASSLSSSSGGAASAAAAAPDAPKQANCCGAEGAPAAAAAAAADTPAAAAATEGGKEGKKDESEEMTKNEKKKEKKKAKAAAAEAEAEAAAKAKSAFEVSHGPNAPCDERLLLMYDRWRKLLKGFYNDKKQLFNISKVPDIYDSSKYDVIHNSHMNLEILPALYTNARRLAGVVIANEYGLLAPDRLSIGSKICTELVGKLLCDLASMREESVATAAPDDDGVVSPNAYEDSMFAEFGRNALDDDRFRGEGGKLGVSQGSGGAPAGSGGGGGGTDSQGDAEPLGDGDHEADILHRLCPTYASDVNSPLRHVRTRIYFTSESHIHSLVNVLRFSHMRPGAPDTASSLLAPDMQALMDETPEFDYLTHIVFRMYENKQMPVHAPERFRVEISFSPGAAFNPLEVQLEGAPQLACGAGSHVLGPHTLDVVPRVILNDHETAAETLAMVDSMLAPLAKTRKVPPSTYALQVALKAPTHARKQSARAETDSSVNDAGAGAGAGASGGSVLSPGLAHADASLTSLLARKK